MHGARNCQVVQLLSRIKYGSMHRDGVLTRDDAVLWRWSLLMPWFIYISVCLLLYIVGDGTAAGLLASCTAVTFITIVVTNGHRISDDNRLVSLQYNNSNKSAQSYLGTGRVVSGCPGRGWCNTAP